MPASESRWRATAATHLRHRGELVEEIDIEFVEGTRGDAVEMGSGLAGPADGRQDCHGHRGHVGHDALADHRVPSG